MPFVATVPYADITYAEAYFAERLAADAWTSLPDVTGPLPNPKKLTALAMATKYIDNVPFVGFKSDTNQVREFPRNNQTTIPDEVSAACCEVALELLKGNTIESMYAHAGIVSEAIGDSNTTYDDGLMKKLHDCFGLNSPEAARLLAGWVMDDEVFDIERVR